MIQPAEGFHGALRRLVSESGALLVIDETHALVSGPAGLTAHWDLEPDLLVAILNTTLPTIGRPDELRDQLFAKTLRVTTLAPLAEPGATFADLPAVDGWRQDGSGAYILDVSDVVVAAPTVTRALVAAGADVLSVNESHHSLEDIYLQLINETEAPNREPA